MEPIPSSTEDTSLKNRSLELTEYVKSKEQDFKRCCDLYFNTHNRGLKRSPLYPSIILKDDNTRFILRVLQVNDSNFIWKLRYFKLFNLGRMELYQAEAKPKNIFSFLENSFPEQVNNFMFSSGLQENLGKLECFNCILKISPRICKSVYFDQFIINYHQLKRLISSYKHVRIFTLGCCKLSVPAIADFSKALRHTQIEELRFYDSGDTNYYNWKEYPDQVNNLIKGLGSSPDLRLTLKMVNITGSGISKKVVRKILKESGFGKVNVHS
ncbi:unnamed protein product [Moneuplotes crassus]|uniref:Uncharacterized protein n=1 Tax=Euplotes crassus TaxID=5936 RepID=A0AAD1UII4_EUPCR|nr:unnamed protein product [Moneuplotes crassus]